VRWDHPQRGVVPPSEFLSAAERSGLIVDLGRFVLRTACEQVAQWRHDWPNLNVAVNVSHRELLDPEFTANVEDVLTSTGLPAHALHLEITETVVAAEEDISRTLQSLTTLGVELSIDDFGTGHSSLSRLRQLPAHRLKIDKSFVGDIHDDGSAVLLSSIIALAHALGRTVVAEGVETAEQCEFLTAQGCDEMQGYLFSRPVDAPHVVPLLFGTRSSGKGQVMREQRAFGCLVETLLEPSQPLDSVLPALLAELTAISGLQSAFVTEVRPDLGSQITRFAHNAQPEQMQVQEGLTLDWGQTLCRRMLEDKVLCETQVGARYSDVEIAATLGIETYVSVPVHDTTGILRGTLCAASNERIKARHAVIELMQLFAQALAERLLTAPPTLPDGRQHPHEP
jgi:EAL domain-containing protein (putative c-di-GMP-specific phosphodiesterase class I)